MQEELIDVSTRIDRLKTLARRVDNKDRREVLHNLVDAMLGRDTLRARLRYVGQMPIHEFNLVRRELDAACRRLRRGVDSLWAQCAT